MASRATGAQMLLYCEDSGPKLMKKNIETLPNIESFFGKRDENLHLLEDGLNVSVELKSNGLELEGAQKDVARAEQILLDYAQLMKGGYVFHNGDLGAMLRIVISDPNATLRDLAEAGRQRSSGISKRVIQPKSLNQKMYLEAIEKNDMVFGIGPAGTGKTYLAVAMAVSALMSKQVSRILLARPAGGNGERLGVPPGTLPGKIRSYIPTLY